jgi:hypothetical protein
VSNIFTLERLTNHIEQLRTRLHPVLEAMGSGYAKSHDEAVQKVRRQVQARVKRVNQMVTEPMPEVVEFNDRGAAVLTRWQPFDLKSSATLEQVDLDGRRALHIVAGPEGKCSASWRSATLLQSGSYVFEARLRTAGIVPLTENPSRGLGAGIRISKAGPVRTNGFTGDTNWVRVEYEVAVDAEKGEQTFVCELRAAEGEVWFDLASLRLRRLK